MPYIKHVGILGMKWGRRKDYSYQSKTHRKNAEHNARVLSKITGQKLNKPPRRMSDQELHKAMSRMMTSEVSVANRVSKAIAISFVASYLLAKGVQVLNS